MTAQIKSALRPLYYQHGIFTFLLFFVPLLPGFVETHTKVYLTLLKLSSMDIKDAETAIRVVFGRRGAMAYHQFKLDNPDIIRPPQIFRALYHPLKVQHGMGLVKQMLNDPIQRRFPLSHLYRATLFEEIPYLLNYFSAQNQLSFQSQLLTLLINAKAIEQAPKALTALNHALAKIERLHRLRLAQAQQRITNQHFDHLSTKPLGNLVKPTSIYSMPYRLT